MVLAPLFLSPAVYVRAQINTGDITGRITDPANAVVGGADVVAVNLDTQQRFGATSNVDGQYLLA